MIVILNCMWSPMNSMWYNIKKEFPLLDQYGDDLIYLDNASTTHKPQSIIDAMSVYQSTSYANIHRGIYSLAEQSELLYDDSKKKIAQWIGWDFHEVIYTYNATYACNILAQSLVQTYQIWQDDVVLVGIRDHHATIVPLQLLAQQYGFEVKFIPLCKDLSIDWDGYQSLLSSYRVKAVMCSHVSNVTGIVYDVQQLTKLAQVYDIFVAIDGSQAVPHMQVDVSSIWCDAYIFTWHKVLWPTGIGVLWIRKQKVRILQTTWWWWGIVEEVTTEWCSLVRTAQKFEPGTPNLIGAIWLWAAYDFYQTHQIYRDIHAHTIWLYQRLYRCLEQIDGLQLLPYQSDNHIGIVSFAVEDMMWCIEYLADHHIAVRWWWHCAHPLLTSLGHTHWLVRISPFVYNTIDEMDRVFDVIEQYMSDR